MGQVGLETDRLGHAGGLEGVDHVLPGMHAAPADLALGGESLAVVGGHPAGFAEGLGDPGGVAGGVLGPVLDAVGGVDADDPAIAGTVVVHDFRDAAGLFDGEDEVPAVLLGAEGRATHRSRPDGSDEGTDFQAVSGDLVAEGLEVVLGAVDVHVRAEEPEVDPVVFLAVGLGIDGKFEHAVETDGRVVGVGFLADHAGPHGVV